jgi:hypothetical protein
MQLKVTDYYEVHVHEVQYHIHNTSLSKCQFKAHEINCSAKLPRLEIDTSLEDAYQAYVCNKNIFLAVMFFV